jgi:hypothetical protein
MLRPHRTARILRGWFEKLEGRTLLSGASPADIAGTIPLALGPAQTVNGTVAPGAPLFYRITPDAAGLLTAQVHAVGAEARLSLLNAQGQVLVQSDGQSRADTDPLINQHLPASNVGYLEVESLAGAGNAALTTQFTAASDPFATIPRSSTAANSAQVVLGDFNDDGIPDYVTIDGVHLGTTAGVFLPAIPGTSLVLGNESPFEIVAADFTGRGINTDLAVSYKGSNEVRILLGNGDGTFRAATVIGLPAPSALAVGDFTGNGHTDLAVANGTANVVTILAGDGKGNFAIASTISVNLDGSALMVAADFTGDGRTDLAVGSFVDNQVTFLVNQGHGSFLVGAPFGSFLGLNAFAVGQFSGDGHDDLAAVDVGLAPGTGSVTILQARADGTVVPDQLPITFAAIPFSIGTGDFTGRGHADLVVGEQGLSSGTGDVVVLLNDGAGRFENAGTIAPGLQPGQIVSGRFTSAAHTDLVIAVFGRDDPTILLGQGDGTFLPAPPQSATPMVLGDFNHDGLVDYATTDGVHLGTGDGTFRSPPVGAALSSFVVAPSSVVALPFGDSTDLAVTSPVSNDVTILKVNGDGSLQVLGRIPVGLQPEAIAAGDFTGDGHTDLAVADFGSDDVTILLGQADGTFHVAGTIPVGQQPDAIVAADFRGNGRTDLAVADSRSNDVTILLGNGDGRFRVAGQISVGESPVSLAAGDFRGDDHIDLAVADYGTIAGTGEIVILRSNGDGTFSKLAPLAIRSVSNPQVLLADEFDKDGKTDLVVGDFTSNDVSVLQSDGDDAFHVAATIPVGQPSYALGSRDANGDGRTDLFVADEHAVDVEVLAGNGDGSFRNVNSDPAGLQPVSIVSADFNGDGRPDVAVVNEYTQDVTILLGNGDGTFRRGAVIPVGLQPIAAVVGDFNGDGRPDLAVADGVSNDVTILLGNGDGTFRDTGTYPAGTAPAAIAAGDFNGDGHTDLAVANALSNDVTILLGDGLGTFQTAPPISIPVPLENVLSDPLALAAGDFDGQGRDELAVACFTSSDVVIVKVNRDGTSQIANAVTINGNCSGIAAGVFGPDGRTDLAVVSSLVDQVTILDGDGHGAFRIASKIGINELEAPSAITTAHVNSNGVTDLVVVYYDLNLATLLLGKGDGTFQAPRDIVPDRPGGVEWVAPVDLTGDGRTDFVFALTDPSDIRVSLSLGGGEFADPNTVNLGTRNVPLFADLNGDATPDIAVVDSAGRILVRMGRPGQPRSFDPPIVANPGIPSRDIAAIPLDRGVLLASADALDDAVSLFLFDATSDHFNVVGLLETRNLPAQIVAGDLDGNGRVDLVVRNAADGTLSIFYNDPSGSIVLSPVGSDSNPVSLPRFFPALTIPVGAGVSDVSLADLSGAGRLDILAADKNSGDIRILHNRGNGKIDPPVILRAGSGPYGLGDIPQLPNVTALEATSGVAAGVTLPGGLADLIAIDPGSNTFALLASLGNGRYANPRLFDTLSPASMVRAGDFSNDGLPDLVVLDASGVEVFRNTGDGTFVGPTIIDAGEEPTGLTVADVNGNGNLDLLISNPFGDVLVLPGNGDGTFGKVGTIDKRVALATGSATPGGAQYFIFAEPGSHRILIEQNGIPIAVVQNPSDRFAPGAVQLANLNNDGVNYLVVANSGSNNVLIYPVLPSGRVGPEINGGDGFFTGTEPVGITVADVDGDGRLDLVIANKGSNDVSILLNEKRGDGFTMVQGPRLKAGFGPTATLVADVDADGVPDLFVSNSESNNVMLMKGVGNGFFDDTRPIVFQTGAGPGQMFLGNFDGRSGQLDLVTLNSGSNDLTLIPDLTGRNVVPRNFSSGGESPVAGVEEVFPGGITVLLVANSGDGRLTLFVGGMSGLDLVQSIQFPGEHPSALAIDSSGAVFAGFEGSESAVLVALGLGVPGGTNPGVIGTSALPTAPGEQQVAPLLEPLGEMSMAIVATLLSVSSESTSGVPLPPNQSPTGNPRPIPFDEAAGLEANDDEGEVSNAGQTSSGTGQDRTSKDPLVWFVSGVEEAFQTARRYAQDDLSPARTTPSPGSQRTVRSLDVLLAQRYPDAATVVSGLVPAMPATILRTGTAAARIVDAALHSLGSSPAWIRAGSRPRANHAPGRRLSESPRPAAPIGGLSVGATVLALTFSDLVQPPRARRPRRKLRRFTG